MLGYLDFGAATNLRTDQRRGTADHSCAARRRVALASYLYLPPFGRGQFVLMLTPGNSLKTLLDWKCGN